jgi:hypothetical protein
MEGKGGGGEGKGGDRGKEGEMTQPLYAHMNKKNDFSFLSLS